MKYGPVFKKRKSKLLGSIIAVFALVLGLVTPPHVIAADDPKEGVNSDVVQIDSGSVTWGIRESWRTYIGDGAFLYDGVRLNEKREYVWPIKSGSYDPSTKALHLKLGGYIHNLAYCQPPDSTDNCTLDVLLKELEVDITPEKQQITGIFIGNSRDNTQIKELPRAVWANLKLNDAKVDANDTHTKIEDLRGFLEEFPLYTKGGVADPVSIEYDGPGGLPETGRELGKPGERRLVIDPNGTVIPGFPKEGYQRYYDVPLYPLENENLVIFTEGENSENPGENQTIKFSVVDTNERKVIHTLEYAFPRPRSGANLQFDGKHSFYLLRREEGAPYTKDYNAPTTAPATLTKVSFENGELSVKENLWRVIPGQEAITGWDPVRGKLIFTTRHGASGEPGQIYLVDPDTATEGSNDAQSTALAVAVPTDNLAHYPGANFNKSAGFPIGRAKPAVLKDGSYIFPSGGIYGDNGGIWYEGDDGEKHLYPPVWMNFDDPLAKEYGVLRGQFLPAVAPTPGKRGADELGGWSMILPTSDNKFFALASHLDPILNFYALEDVEIVPGFNGKKATPVWDNQIEETYESSHRNAAYSEQAGFGVYYGATYQALMLFDETGKKQELLSDQLRPLGSYSGNIAMWDAGKIIFGGLNADKEFTLYTASAPRFAEFTEHPTSQTINLGDEDSLPVEFSAAADDQSTDVQYQWQRRGALETTFEDIPGATDRTLSLTANSNESGSAFRCLAHTPAGWVASEEATLNVTWNPQVAVEAQDQAVSVNSDAVFEAAFNAPPETALGWERYDKSTGLWNPIDADGDVFSIKTEGNTTTLTISHVNPDMSGMRVRALARTSAGDLATTDASLTVRSKGSDGSEKVSVKNVRFLWGVGGELQVRPPAGGANYLSAGVSDGTESSYKSKEDNVTILFGKEEGPFTEPTYDSRADFVGKSNQFVELTAGSGEINADGSATISWPGSFSINSYGGMVPFTLSNLKLDVKDNGTGTLYADLSGYGASITNPQDKHPLETRAGVRVANFKNVVLEPSGSVKITPVYKGVKVNVPEDFRPQNTEAPGWGSWPQEFVDYQFLTGLSSYWYTSSADEDTQKKAPLPFIVDFSKADVSGSGPGHSDPGTTPGTPSPTDTVPSPTNTPQPAGPGSVKVIVEKDGTDQALVKALSTSNVVGIMLGLLTAIQTFFILVSLPGPMQAHFENALKLVPGLQLPPLLVGDHPSV